MLFTIPGIPSIYYGSELGIKGKRGQYDDYELRPALPPFADLPSFASPETDSGALQDVIRRFAQIRQKNQALQKGSYCQLAITNTQFMFARNWKNEEIVIAVNSEPEEKEIKNELTGTYCDLLNGGSFSGKELQNLKVPATWIRILKRQ